MTNKPIAIITKSLTSGIDWAEANLSVREVRGRERRIVDTSGQVYIIVWDAEQLIGWEIKDYVITAGAGLNKNLSEIVSMAGQRMRNDR